MERSGKLDLSAHGRIEIRHGHGHSRQAMKGASVAAAEPVKRRHEGVDKQEEAFGDEKEREKESRGQGRRRGLVAMIAAESTLRRVVLILARRR